MISIYDCKTEYKENPQGIDERFPRFAWKINSKQKNVNQLSYQIKVSDDNGIVWDSGIVSSNETRFIRYQGKPLKSRVVYAWAVSISCESDSAVERAESEVVYFEMGLLDEEDWKAKWIEPVDEIADEERKPSPMLRFTFELPQDGKKIRRARLYQTAHGLYESYVNGVVTSEDKFKPGLTSYYYRIQYQIHDITQLLSKGKNAWTVQLGDGWWRGTTGGSVIHNFGRKLGYLGQLEITYEDGSVKIFESSKEFKYATGALLASDMMMGDIYDARIEESDWRLPNYDDSSWENVVETEVPRQENTKDDYYKDAVSKSRTSGLYAKKIASMGVPVREKEQFLPKVLQDSKGNIVLDFGQNIAGYVAMTLRNTRPGQVVTLTHGETLDFEGTFTTCNVDHTSYPIAEFQKVTYICKGALQEQYRPLFSIFGFRYVNLEGIGLEYKEQIEAGDFTAIAVYSDMGETAKFTCSNLLLNQLYSNCMWSQKGNFMDVPVDCPTRERNAWTGDAQIYAKTSVTLMGAYPFYEKWLQDQVIEQYESGKVGITFPSTSSVHNPAEVVEMKKLAPMYEIAGPSGNGNIGEDAAGWGDSATWIPYVLYQCSGDKQILKNQYETARKWLEFELSCAHEHNSNYEKQPQYQNQTDGELDADYIFDTRFHYGEWNEAIGLDDVVKKAKEEWKQKKESADKKKTKEQMVAEAQVKAGAVAQALTYLAKQGNAVVATAYMARSAENVAEMASILGKKNDAEKYARIADKIKMMYAKYLIGDDGIIEEGHQAPYVRALAMNLCGEKKEKVLTQLLKEVKTNDYKLNTGFLSTPFLLPVLCENGYSETAYKILENEDMPGWLYPVKQGLTTIPESWQASDTLKDSLNHYSYGAVSDFLISYVAGIKALTPGYREIVIEPVAGGTLTHTRAEFDSPCGTIVSAWEKKQNEVHYHFEIPANTTAHIRIHGMQEQIFGSGSFDVSCDNSR